LLLPERSPITSIVATESVDFLNVAESIADVYATDRVTDAYAWDAAGWLGAGVLVETHFYLHSATRMRELRLEQLLDHVQQTVARRRLLSLYHGITGAGWLLSHVGKAVGAPYDLDELDDWILDQLNDSEPQHFDLVTGLAGVGIYAIERMPAPTARAILDRVVELLATPVRRHAERVAWWPGMEPTSAVRREVPKPVDYTLGVAHGAAGAIAVLADAAKLGVRNDVASATLEQAVPWLLSHMFATPHGLALPRSAADPEPRFRLAWCHNGLGTAIPLLRAADAVGRTDWAEQVHAMLLSVAGTAVELTGVRDACYCHGAAGVAHIMSLAARRFDDSALDEAAGRWMKRTLQFRTPGQEPLGFSFVTGNENDVNDTTAFELVQGVGAIGLTLLSHSTGQVPSWNRFFGLS
jgi:lantibiotic modifying enzyme